MSSFTPQLAQEVSGQSPSANPAESAGTGSDPPNSPTPGKPSYAKRGKITIVACMPCRKRKTKCDGKRPSCSQCMSRDSPCQYDMTDDQRKLTFLRDNVEALESKSNVLESLLLTIQTATEDEAGEVFRRLRSGVTIRTVAEQVQAGQLLSGVAHQPSSQSTSPVAYGSVAIDPNVVPRLRQYDRLMQLMAMASSDAALAILQRIQAREDVSGILNAAQAGQLAPQPIITSTAEIPHGLEGEYTRRERQFAMINSPDVAHTHSTISQSLEFNVTQQRSPWTTITQDDDFIEHLLTMYFTWQHSFFQSFPEDLFRTDMRAGRTKYCSSMLVNAICAAGCFLSDRPQAHQDRGDGQTMVSSFFDEALKLMMTADTSSITATATMYLLSYIEGTRGRLSSLWNFSGRSALMALDINLHLRREPRQHAEPRPDEANENRARVHAFWGCFHVDQTTSFTLGRVPNININSVTTELPPLNEEEDKQPWAAEGIHVPNRSGARATTFRQCSALSRLVNRTLLMFFAPSVALTGSRLLQAYQEYLDWYADLPASVKSTRDAPPHVLCLHMYYHTAVLLLFRPFLKATLTNSDVVPREVCRQAATAISDMWSEHRRLYGLMGIYMFQVHCLLTACTIHIVNVPALSATNYLTDACNTFQDLVHRNEWARSSLDILRALVQKWGRVLPQEAEEALFRNRQDARPHSMQLESNEGGPPEEQTADANAAGPSHAPSKRTSISLDSSRSSSASVGAAGTGAGGPKRQRLVMPPHLATLSPMSPTATTTNVMQSPMNYLYAPLADQPAPLLAPVHLTSSSRDSGAALDDQTGQRLDELNGIANGLDGLSFADDWRDPFMGFGADAEARR